ncbi:hypothetical protein JXA32_02040 [Candidatus Sumerlaeota bacterium]|nr:hypothetical protein [Candidatus Sumerlaeota bacterium]
MTATPDAIPFSAKYNGRPQSVVRSFLLQSVSRRFIQLMLLALLIVAGGASGWILLGFETCIDDAFITFRTAENFAAGDGPYYNPGERVQVSTSPLYLMLLAALRKVAPVSVLRIETVIQALTFSATAALLWLFGYLLLRDKIYACLFPLIYFLQPQELMFIKGMETMLFGALALAAGLCAARRWNLATGILLGLVACARTEGALICVAYAVYWLVGRIAYGKNEFRLRDLLTTAGACLLTGLPFLWLLLTHYDSVLPDSVTAKMHQAHLGWNTVLSFWKTYLVRLDIYIPIWGLLLLFLACAAPWTFYRLRRLDIRAYRLLGLIGLFGALHAAAFIIGRAPGSYPWYLYAPKLMLIPFFGVAIAGLWRWRCGLEPLGFLVSDAAAAAVIESKRQRYGILLASVITGYGLGYCLFFFPMYLASVMEGGYDYSEYKCYKAMGQWLNRYADPEWTFAAPEIGIVGYHSGLRCEDVVGIATPANLQRLGRDSFSKIAYDSGAEIFITPGSLELDPSSKAFDAQWAERFRQRYRLLLHERTDGCLVEMYARKDLTWPDGLIMENFYRLARQIEIDGQTKIHSLAYAKQLIIADK